MEFMYGQKGRLLLLYSGYKYYKEYGTAEGWKWRCVGRSCKAKLYLNDDSTEILKSDTCHNHQPPSHISRQLISNSLKRKAIQNFCDKPAKLIRQEVAAVSTSHAENIDKVDIDYMKKNIYRTRRKLLPPLLKFIADVQEFRRRLEIHHNEENDDVEPPQLARQKIL